MLAIRDKAAEWELPLLTLKPSMSHCWRTGLLNGGIQAHERRDCLLRQDVGHGRFHDRRFQGVSRWKGSVARIQFGFRKCQGSAQIVGHGKARRVQRRNLATVFSS